MTLAGSVPGSPFIAAPVRRTLSRANNRWEGAPLRIDFSGGGQVTLGSQERGAPAELSIRNSRAVRRVLAGGDIGFAEGYIAGDWTTPDLPKLMTVLAANFDALESLGLGGFWSRLFEFRRKWLQANTRSGSRRNIHAHYDLGNDFYEAWLDETMTYSSGMFGREDETLSGAQLRKYRSIAEVADLKPGQTVLEIGCGWGGFAEFAAREYACRVTAVTISEAQHDYARRRISEAGLQDKVEVVLRDYRDLAGHYDRIVSIEMFEAVGERYWPTFFEVLRRRLAPGGRAALQVITIREDLFPVYRSRVDFIQRYVFPGGMLPSVKRLHEAAGAAGLASGELRRFGLDYARTMRSWYERFERAWPSLAGERFDERFHRVWAFYLAYCEAGFATRRTDVVQLGLSPA